MRSILAIVGALLFATVVAVAFPYGHGGGGQAQPPACTFIGGGPPSPNGSCIQEPGPGSTIVDGSGNSWAFDGVLTPLGTDAQFTLNGGAFSSAYQLQIDSGSGNVHNFFRKNRAAIPVNLLDWDVRSTGSGDFIPVNSPTATAIGNIFLNTTTGVNEASPSRLFNNAAASNALTIPAITSGRHYWSAGPPIVANGVTLTCTVGAPFYNTEIGLNADNLTVNNCESDYAQSGPSNPPSAGFRLYCGHSTWTLTNPIAKENDDGILGGCDALSITITNMLMQHNGYYNAAGDCSGFDHGVYIFANNSTTYHPDRTTVTISGGYGMDQRCSGDPLKLRNFSGTVTNYSTGQSGQYASDPNLNVNWPMSMPCGGAWTVSHDVLIRGPNTAALGGNWGIADYGSEWPGNLGNDYNCPTVTTFTGNVSSGSNQITNVSTITDVTIGAAISGSGLPSTNGSLLTVIAESGTGPFTITLSGNATGNATGATYTTGRNHVTTYDSMIFIDDGDSGAGSQESYPVRCGSGTTSCSGKGFNLTVSNSIFVLTVNPGCSAPLTGVGVTDGGGNQCFTSRAAAATALGWSGADHWGNPCCLAPWMPAHL